MSRLPVGGRVDRTDVVRFTVDGDPMTGLRGDTVASALIAAGRLTVGPSLYARRPRGLLTAGVEEPNAVVQVLGPYRETLVPATVVELVEGLEVRFRSGVGRLEPAGDPFVYDKRYVHVDVLVVGAGPAGLAAAQAASSGEARVLLVDEQPELGGRLLADQAVLHGAPAVAWVARAAAGLAARPEVRVLTRATALGCHDHREVLVLERRTDHLDGGPPPGLARHRLWHVRARQVVLATGAIERPLVFAGNDRPGVVLASAVRSWINRYAVVPGRRAVVSTVDDSGYQTVDDLLRAGVTVAAVCDSRARPPVERVAALTSAGVRVLAGSVPVATRGDGRLRGVALARLAETVDGTPAPLRLAGPPTEVDADLLAVAGGWTPQVQLLVSARGTVRWDDERAAYLPEVMPPGIRVAGAVNGGYDLAGCLGEGAAAGAAAAGDAGFDRASAAEPAWLPPVASEATPVPARPVWLVPGLAGEPGQWGDHIVDLERDATVADVWRAVGAGLQSIEHIKRYTTIGTGRDQGRTSSITVVGVVSLATGRPMAELGASNPRPPVIPVPFAALAGRDVGHLHDPIRTTPLHGWHERHGARFEIVGQWLRARHYPRPGESADQAVLRECRAARTGVAMMDATTLGKIEIVGAGAATFLDRVYTGVFSSLAVGSGRYGVMCTADGMVLDDGVTLRLAAGRFLTTTTTGNAARVLDWLEEWHQTEWPELDLRLTSVTEQWVTIAVVGPRSRDVVATVAPELDLSVEGFAFMAFRETTLADGVPARIARISFSGELAYEVNVASWYGEHVWESIARAGAPLGITPYGTDAMHVLRAEKGYPIIGQDTDGTVTPLDLGLGWAVSKRKDFIGRRSLSRQDCSRPDRKQLVALLPVDPDAVLPEGAQLVAEGVPITPGAAPVPMLGHVTSSYRSAALGRTFALALVAGGRARIGQRVVAPLADPPVVAVVSEPVCYDPQGARRDG
jgi:sarcosine oxidase, subunit alpha